MQVKHSGYGTFNNSTKHNIIVELSGFQVVRWFMLIRGSNVFSEFDTLQIISGASLIGQ